MSAPRADVRIEDGRVVIDGLSLDEEESDELHSDACELEEEELDIEFVDD